MTLRFGHPLMTFTCQLNCSFLECFRHHDAASSHYNSVFRHGKFLLNRLELLPNFLRDLVPSAIADRHFHQFQHLVFLGFLLDLLGWDDVSGGNSCKVHVPFCDSGQLRLFSSAALTRVS